MKKCSKCELEKDTLEFCKNRNTSDGLCRECKICHYGRRKTDAYRIYKSEWNKRYRATNKIKLTKKGRADRAKWRADKFKRTPEWADLKAIKLFYVQCPPGYEVDHIIPLRGKTISGLHVLSNLQYLPFKENRVKGNRF